MNFSKRDIVILAVLLGLAVGFTYWQLLLSPLFTATAEQEEILETKREELATEIRNLQLLDVLRPQPGEIMTNINTIADKYLPDRTVQFYYDMLNEMSLVPVDRVNEPAVLTLRPIEVETRPLTSIVFRENSSRTDPNSLEVAIDEYDEATKDTPTAEATPTESGNRPAAGRYAFKYVPITYKMTDGYFEMVQDYIQGLNDLDWTMYFPSVVLEINDFGTIDTTFQVYFISINRLIEEGDDPDGVYTTEDDLRKMPAGRNDPYKYRVPKEEEN